MRFSAKSAPKNAPRSAMALRHRRIIKYFFLFLARNSLLTRAHHPVVAPPSDSQVPPSPQPLRPLCTRLHHVQRRHRYRRRLICSNCAIRRSRMRMRIVMMTRLSLNATFPRATPAPSQLGIDDRPMLSIPRRAMPFEMYIRFLGLQYALRTEEYCIMVAFFFFQFQRFVGILCEGMLRIHSKHASSLFLSF